MQQIADWLEKLGMSEYAERFAENRIDLEVLPELTDHDLKDLAWSLGDRRKILRAIREPALNQSACRSALHGSQRSRTGNHRRRRTPPSHGDVLGPCRLDGALCAHGPRRPARSHFGLPEVRRGDRGSLRGFVAKYMGDGVLVYFGYPQAHEDDAERAVRAGLELVAAVSGLKTDVPLQTRVGIATGLVVVGDLIGSGASQEQAIVGETPNLAARLQGIAEPNMVVIAESTRKLLGNLFELEDLGAKDLKGIAGPARAWAALRPTSAESRFEALHAGSMTSWSGGRKNLTSCCAAGRRQKPAKGKWCCSPVNLASANLD